MTRIGRREFLRLSALGVPMAARSSFPPQGAGAPSADPVVIVGAGLAGLQAASVLQKAGQHVVVLEARAEAGGRVRTQRAPFDEELFGELGPIRIPGMHATVLKLAADHGLSLVPFALGTGSALIGVRGVTARVPEDASRVTSTLALGPEEAGLGQGALLQRYVRDLPRDIGTLAPTAESYASWESLDRVTWPAWLRSRGASADAVALMTLGGDSSALSALYVLRQYALLQGTDQFFKIQGGMDRLPRAMASALGSVVRFNSPVVRVDQTSRPVRLDYLANGRPETIRASRVILTIPFSMLRRIDIRPKLPASRATTVAGLPYFPATRFLLQSKTRFWEEAGLSGIARTDQPAEVWDSTYDVPATAGILGANVGGRLGTSLSGVSRTKALEIGTGLVTKTFPDLRHTYQKGSVHRWELDSWSRGAFAVFHPGQMTAMMPDIARPEDRLHFAGEHTSHWMGWMEGALESGERAAREILSHTAGRVDVPS
jgi:monoamine oxidase